MKEGCQIDPPPPTPEKTTLKKPSLIRVNILSISKSANLIMSLK